MLGPGSRSGTLPGPGEVSRQRLTAPLGSRDPDTLWSPWAPPSPGRRCPGSGGHVKGCGAGEPPGVLGPGEWGPAWSSRGPPSGGTIPGPGTQQTGPWSGPQCRWGPSWSVPRRRRGPWQMTPRATARTLLPEPAPSPPPQTGVPRPCRRLVCGPRSVHLWPQCGAGGDGRLRVGGTVTAAPGDSLGTISPERGGPWGPRGTRTAALPGDSPAPGARHRRAKG